MRHLSYSAARVLFWSYALFIVGLFGMCQELVPQILDGDSPNLGLVVGYGAIMLTGLATFVIGRALKNLEEKLARLEATIEERS